MSAQTFPDYNSKTVNDFADLLAPAQERQLSADLTRLRRDTGIEMTVVTLPSQTPYAPHQSMEQFATDLFNHWGVGTAQRNDGIMVLVLRQDRAMRIELGAGFAQAWNGQAERIIERDFLPMLREDRYADGILRGSAAVIQQIAIPFSEGADRPAQDVIGTVLLGVMVVILGLATQYQRLYDFAARWRVCPECGTKGTLRAQRRTVRAATRNTGGIEEKTTTCLNCDYRDTHSYETPAETGGSSGGSFGGGSSGGGGGSGRW